MALWEMERETWFQFLVPFLAVCFILLVLTLTHSFEIDEEFEKEEPPPHTHTQITTNGFLA